MCKPSPAMLFPPPRLTTSPLPGAISSVSLLTHCKLLTIYTLDFPPPDMSWVSFASCMAVSDSDHVAARVAQVHREEQHNR